MHGSRSPIESEEPEEPETQEPGEVGTYPNSELPGPLDKEVSQLEVQEVQSDSDTLRRGAIAMTKSLGCASPRAASRDLI
jgi:hypothetical protein